jgi:ankyrin repeat protein/serine/threonine protein kinase
MGVLKACEYVVDLHGAAFIEVGQEVKPTLVVELAIGNLAEFFRSALGVASWTMKGRFASHISSALQAVHSQGIVHADVKAQNVLIFLHESTQFCAKLSDFGNSITAGADYPIAAGTVPYLAPECLSPKEDSTCNEKYGNARYRDAYAFGILVWEMATECRQLPFYDVDPDELPQMKRDGDNAARNILGHLPEDTPLYLREIIRTLLQPDPLRRDSLNAVTGRLRSEIERSTNSTTTLAPELDGNEFSQIPKDSLSCSLPKDSEQPTVKIPWSLQKRLYEESKQSTILDIDSRVFLAYCYLLCSSSNSGLRKDALSLLQQSARIDPFHLVPGAKLTPFRAMMELEDWEGLSDILPASQDTSLHPEFADKCRQHIYSFGWQRFIVLACAARVDTSQDLMTSDTLHSASESVAVGVIRLVANTGMAGVGQATWGEDKLGALHMAAVCGKSRAVSALLATGADPSVRDRDGRTPLHLCCQAVELSDDLSLDVAKVFWEHQPASVEDVMERTLYTPVRFAIEAEKQRLCQALLQNGANANACAANGSTALQECAWIADERGNGRRGDSSKNEDKAVELARVLLTYGKVDINLRSCHNSVTALGIAAAHGNSLPMVSLLLDHGADPQTSVDDLTTLGAAVQHNNHDMLSALLRHKADPNYSVRGLTPLGLAVGLDRHDMTPILLEHGASVVMPHQGLPLVCWAIHSHAGQYPGSDEVCPNLTLLLQHNAPVHETSQLWDRGAPPGWSALHFAALSLSKSVLSLIMDREDAPNLSARTKDGETALHIPIMYANNPAGQNCEDHIITMLKELVNRGIDLDATTTLGETALHCSSQLHLTTIRDCLLEAGCNPNILHPSGRTAQELYELDEETIRREAWALRKDRKRRLDQESAKASNTEASVNSGEACGSTPDTDKSVDSNPECPAIELDVKELNPVQDDADSSHPDGVQRDVNTSFVVFSGWGMTSIACTALMAAGLAVCMCATYFRH